MEWTDDMTVRLAPGTTLQALSSFLGRARSEGLPRRSTLLELAERFGLSFEDARLCIGRHQAGIVRARSGNRANKPDQAKDPVAWLSYRTEQGLSAGDDADPFSAAQREQAAALLEGARRREPTRGTNDVGVAIIAAELAVASTESDDTRYYLLLEAATAVSVAAEALIDTLGGQPCAQEGSQQWADGLALASAARAVTARFAAQPDPDLEERGLALVGRIVTRLLGQSYAHVGRAMYESSLCIQRNGDPDRAAAHVGAVLVDFVPLLNRLVDEDPVDEDVIALEYLRGCIELVEQVRGRTGDLGSLLSRTEDALSRGNLG